jgi:hypothetical protein
MTNPVLVVDYNSSDMIYSSSGSTPDRIGIGSRYQLSVWCNYLCAATHNHFGVYRWRSWMGLFTENNDKIKCNWNLKLK